MTTEQKAVLKMEKFYVREYKKLMEHDSPVQGWTDIIVEEEILYGSVSKKESFRRLLF